jgi:hypothetical protein
MALSRPETRSLRKSCRSAASDFTSTPGRRSVGDELEQAAIGIAEVNARSLALGAEPGHRAGLDFDSVCGKVRDRTVDRAGPDEAEVTVPGPNRKASYVRRWEEARAMDVELGLPQPIGDAVARPVGNELGAEDVAIEPVRDVPIGDADDAVIKANSRRSIGANAPPCRRFTQQVRCRWSARASRSLQQAGVEGDLAHDALMSVRSHRRM